MPEKNYDFIVLGGGGTGLASAMYAARLGMKTLVLGHSHGIELPIGGVITTTNVIENYPGFIKLSGVELAKKLEEHAKSYHLVDIMEERASEIRKKRKGFFIRTNKGRTYTGKAIVFATGTRLRKLEGIKGIKEFENKGVSYCALCDAPLYRNKIIAVIGGSDTAAKEALLLSEYAKKVYIIYRGEQIHPEPINLERIRKNKKIEIINNTNIKEIKGKESVSGIVFEKFHKGKSSKRGQFKGKKQLEVQGIFVAIGHMPISDLAKTIGVKLNKADEIIIDHKTSETNVPGIYAAGDVTDKPFKQLITGVADGCTAAHSAYEYINKKKIED